MIITVTGLKVKSAWLWPVFWSHAIPAFSQCRAAAGCIHAEAFRDRAYIHTLTAFETRADVQAFARSGAHRKAAQAFRRIATGKILSWEADSIPKREEALAIWSERAEWY